VLLRFSGGRGFVKVPSCLLACLTGKDGRDDELLVFRERSDQLFCLGRGLERVIRLTRRPLPCSALSETKRDFLYGREAKYCRKMLLYLNKIGEF